MYNSNTKLTYSNIIQSLSDTNNKPKGGLGGEQKVSANQLVAKARMTTTLIFPPDFWRRKFHTGNMATYIIIHFVNKIGLLEGVSQM